MRARRATKIKLNLFCFCLILAYNKKKTTHKKLAKKQAKPPKKKEAKMGRRRSHSGKAIKSVGEGRGWGASHIIINESKL